MTTNPHHGSRRALGVALAFATLLGAGLFSAVPAQAQDADKAAQAREAFSQGKAFFKEGKYEKAAEMLAKAYALKPHPALLRYLGQTYYKMNKAQMAIKAFKRYLKEAPEAPDKDKVLAKVRELEMVLGASDEEDDKPAPAPVPAPAPAPAPSTPNPPANTKVDLAPTGDDQEMPDALGDKRSRTGDSGVSGSDSTSMLTVTKWVALGVGAGGIAAGAVFMGLASGKANDLETAVTGSGNTDGKTPQVAYSREHHDIQEAFKRNRAAGIVSFVVGGVAAAAAVTLFIIDRGDSKERRASVEVTPMVGSVYGFASQVRF